MFQSRHINNEPPRQSDVRRDPRALLAQRLFGDLNNNFLSLAEKVADRWKCRPIGPVAINLKVVCVMIPKKSDEACEGVGWAAGQDLSAPPCFRDRIS